MTSLHNSIQHNTCWICLGRNTALENQASYSASTLDRWLNHEVVEEGVTVVLTLTAEFKFFLKIYSIYVATCIIYPVI